MNARRKILCRKEMRQKHNVNENNGLFSGQIGQRKLS